MVLTFRKVALALGFLFIPHIGLGDFLPPNDLHLEDSFDKEGGITEEEFHEVIDQAEEIYAPIVKGHRARLRFARNWNNSMVNASAQQFFGSWIVNMYGGLARRPEITKDGFALVVCHELGHHLGGFPKTSWWAANEGNSDYFASLSCARLLWEDEVEENKLAALAIPDYPKQLCDEAYFGAGENRLNLCYRQMLASYSTANLLATLGGTQIDFETPDTKEVARTSHGHPQGQCRLDSYMAGTLCQKAFDTALIPKNESKMAENSCNRADGDQIGVRPRCWFKPSL